MNKGVTKDRRMVCLQIARLHLEIAETWGHAAGGLYLACWEDAIRYE
jgi:hypothetical protein